MELGPAPTAGMKFRCALQFWLWHHVRGDCFSDPLYMTTKTVLISGAPGDIVIIDNLPAHKRVVFMTRLGWFAAAAPFPREALRGRVG